MQGERQGLPSHSTLPNRVPPPRGIANNICLYLLLGKMDLAGWPQPHPALTGPEAVESLIVERNDFFCWQALAIIGGVGVAGQQHIVALSNGPAHSCIDTILRLGSCDDQAFDAARLQLRLQTRLMKGIG